MASIYRSMIEVIPMMPTLFLSVFLSASPAAQLPSVQPTHLQIVQKWLDEHPGLRIAVERDCGDCAEQIAAIRKGMGGAWKPVPGYQPYYAMGDFNGDGYKDFAVVVATPDKIPKHFILLVFNGPFDSSKPQKPAFVSEPMDLAGQGLFFGPPRPKPYRLLVGGFESEGRLLLPKGKGYFWDQSSH